MAGTIVLGTKDPDRRHNNPGRPRYKADIDLTYDRAQFYYDEFYNACRDLSYREMLGLSRTLGYSIRTMYRWRDRQSYPRQTGDILAVLDWTKAGKPLTSQGELSDSMLASPA